MKSWVYLISVFLLRAAIGFSRRLTLAGEASYSFSLYSIICCISCTYFHLMLVSGSFRKKPPHPRFFYYPVSSTNEGNLETSGLSAVLSVVNSAALSWTLTVQAQPPHRLLSARAPNDVLMLHMPFLHLRA